SSGQQLQSSRPEVTTKMYHCLYDTTVQCTSGAVFPVQLWVYSPFNDTVHADDTIAFMVARTYIPMSIPKDSILLEASDVIPLPGDPTSDEYEVALPDCPCVFIFGLGVVSSWVITLPDGVSKAFSVTASDYVHNANMTTTVV
ncbi:hypothetical protein BKA82DRAFT_3970805, partial [Pisolithus tinctorius]